MGTHRLDYSESGRENLRALCEHDKEHSVSISCGKLFVYLIKYLLNKDFAPRFLCLSASQLVATMSSLHENLCSDTTEEPQSGSRKKKVGGHDQKRYQYKSKEAALLFQIIFTELTQALIITLYQKHHTHTFEQFCFSVDLNYQEGK